MIKILKSLFIENALQRGQKAKSKQENFWTTGKEWILPKCNQPREHFDYILGFHLPKFKRTSP